MQNGIFIRVFIASPGDVYEERDEACRVVHNWNAAHSMSRSILVEPVRVETHSQAVQGGHPQDLINGQLLDRCDLLVAILWSRLGTPTAKDLSGTVQEIREFAAEKGADRVLLFFCDRAIPNAADLDQVKAVRDFKESVKQEGLYIQYTQVSDFAEQFRHQLDMALNRLQDDKAFAALSDNLLGDGNEVTFSSQSNTILTVASVTDRSRIALGRMLAGHELSAGGITLNKMGDERSEASWEAGLEELENAGLVEDLGHKREVFRLTRAGYDAADQLWNVLLLRRIESIQDGEYGYVDLAAIVEQPFMGVKLTPAICREKASVLGHNEQLEVVQSDGGLSAVRLTDMSRKNLRENDWLDFSEPENSDIE
jgi:hypothetical protein